MVEGEKNVPLRLSDKLDRFLAVHHAGQFCASSGDRPPTIFEATEGRHLRHGQLLACN